MDEDLPSSWLQEITRSESIPESFKQKAIASRKMLTEKLANYFRQANHYKPKFVKFVQAGSYSHHTAIHQDLSQFDFDILIVFDGAGLSWDNETGIITAISDESLNTSADKKFFSSRVALNHCYNALVASSSHIRNPEVTRTPPSITLYSNEVGYDFLPAFELKSRPGTFVIPDSWTENTWKLSFTADEKNEWTNLMRLTNNNFKILVRLLKIIKASHGWDLSSYALTVIAADAVHTADLLKKPEYRLDLALLFQIALIQTRNVLEGKAVLIDPFDQRKRNLLLNFSANQVKLILLSIELILKCLGKKEWLKKAILANFSVQ